jgi:hypothetical protein
MLESNNRLSSLKDDIEPELLKTKHLKKRVEDLERENATLKGEAGEESVTKLIETE